MMAAIGSAVMVGSRRGTYALLNQVEERVGLRSEGLSEAVDLGACWPEPPAFEQRKGRETQAQPRGSLPLFEAVLKAPEFDSKHNAPFCRLAGTCKGVPSGSFNRYFMPSPTPGKEVLAGS